MFRRMVCILSAAVLVCMLRLPILAEDSCGQSRLISESVEGQAHQNQISELPDVLVPVSVFSEMEESVFRPVPEKQKIPKNKEYPAPILMAMVLSLAVVILMVFTENRRK